MCGYDRDSTFGSEVSTENMLSQINSSLRLASLVKPQLMAITPVGSFFDDNEFPSNVRTKLVEKLGPLSYVKAFQVESRPSFIIDSERSGYLNSLEESFCQKKLIVGIGLETANDYIRKYCINKGFSSHDFIEACDYLHKHNMAAKAYLLLKPPFLSERQAIDDCIKSIQFAIENHVDKIDVFLCRIYSNTLCRWLYSKKRYRAPWLWSAVEVLKNLPTEYVRKVSVSTWGIPPYTAKLPYNCPKCSERIHWLLQLWRLSRNVELIKEMSTVECDCKKLWTSEIETEDANLQKTVQLNQELIKNEMNLKTA